MKPKKIEFNLGEQVLYTAFNHIIDKFENVNADCEVVSKFIKKQLSSLDEVTPNQLTSAFQYLSRPLDEKPNSFKETLAEAFGDYGNRLYDMINKSPQREVTIILDNLEKIRYQISAPGQKSLFR